MPYTLPSKADFVARFPTFAAVEEETYALWAADAAAVTSAQEACLSTRIELATMLATAHYLTQAGVGTGAESQMAAQGASGFTRLKSGSLEIERGKADGAQKGGDWGTTSFGQRFWAMLSPCLAGPRVTGTGALPNWPCGFNGWAGPIPPWSY